jgi:hypothetical protein
MSEFEDTKTADNEVCLCRKAVHKMLVKFSPSPLPTTIAVDFPQTCLLVAISSTFTMRIFCTKVCSKPNSKQRKAAQKTCVQNFWLQNFKPKLQLCNFWCQNFVQKCPRKMLMKFTPNFSLRNRRNSHSRRRICQTCFLLRPYSHETFWTQYCDKKICNKKDNFETPVSIDQPR